MVALTRNLNARSDAGVTVVISTIGEAGGIGKTALAVHWRHRVASDFPDGQIFVDLGGHDAEQPLTPLEVLAWFLRALGMIEAARATGLSVHHPSA